jgi:sterol 24-C-methyltransferase
VYDQQRDPSIPEHRGLAHEIQLGSGIPEILPLSKSREALRAVGFDTEHEEDLAERLGGVEWYYPLEGAVWKVQTPRDMFTVWGTSGGEILITQNSSACCPRECCRSWIASSLRWPGFVNVAKLFTPIYLTISRTPAVGDR